MKRGFIFLLAVLLVLLTGCKEKSNPSAEEEIIQMSEEESPEKEEVKEDEKPERYDVKISDKLSDFQFAVDGVLWTLPSKIELWETGGWSLSTEDKDTELEAESYIEAKHFKKDKTEIMVELVNPETEKKSLKECFVGGITLEYKKDGPVYQFPCDVLMGETVLNEVLKKYGVPTDEYEEKENIYVTYKYGIYKEAEFVFDIENEILLRVSLKNYREPENETEEISDEEPEEVKQYKIPEKLSENPLDYIVSYDEQLYQIPAPVSKFVDNGWKIQEDSSESYVKAGRHGYVTLEKNGQILYAVVKNYAKNTVKAKDTFVTNLSGDFDVLKVPINIGKGIALGMSEEEMKAALRGIDCETKEEDSGTIYTIYSDDTKKNYIQILADKELHLIRSIEVTNSPESLDGVSDEKDDAPDSSVLIDDTAVPDAE